MGLTHLPKTAREAAHFTCCTRVNNGILEHILSSKVHAINALALVAFENDVKRLEQFADSFQEIEHLRQCFAGLKDLVKAALHPDLADMAENPTLRKRLFARLDPMRLASLLEKVRGAVTATAWSLHVCVSCVGTDVCATVRYMSCLCVPKRVFWIRATTTITMRSCIITSITKIDIFSLLLLYFIVSVFYIR